MSKFKRAVAAILAAASLFATLGAGVVEPITFDEVTGDETIDPTEITSETVVDETTADGETTEPSETPDETEEAYEGPELTTLEYEGDTYKVIASYGVETGIPSDSELVVSEISEGSVFDEYVNLTAEALENPEISRVRIFDICFMKDGTEFEPAEGTAVSIKITLDETFSNEVNVVHITDDSEASVISNLNVSEGGEDGGTAVSFDADGFSAYAVVEGPDEVEIETGWRRINTLAELAAHTGEVYIGNVTDGYYMMNTPYDANNQGRKGVLKTKDVDSQDKTHPTEHAAAYKFEPAGAENKYKLSTVVIDPETNEPVTYYLKQDTNSLRMVTDPASATVFTFSDFNTVNKTFAALGTGGYYINQQGSANGKGFCCYNTSGDINNALALWWYDYESGNNNVDPYKLDGVTTGLMFYSNGVSGKGLMAESSTPNALDALSMPVLTQEDDHNDRLFVPDDTDLTMWTFEWFEDDKYYLSAEVDGTTKYLNIDSDGVSVSDTKMAIRVIPGTGSNAGKISLVAGGKAIEYSGVPELGFSTVGSSSSSSRKWLNLVEISKLTSDYVLPYAAKKISVSDDSITDGTRVIIYTRVWDSEKKKYRFYAVDYDGSLYECFEDGDEIQWLDDRINTLLWDVVVYYKEDAEHTRENENRYYELYNEYSEKYISPNATSETVLSDSKIGINLNGRSLGNYYSSIIAWDDANYGYAGVRTDKSDPDHLKIVSYPFAEVVSEDESTDFYFAIVKETSYEDQLHEVQTIDNNLYGITMKVIDFNLANTAWASSEQSTFLGSSNGGAGANPTQGLLSTNLGDDGYPVATKTNQSLGILYDPARMREVNHLFIESTYSTSGYFVYDSTQNFASLQPDNNFIVYQELGTVTDKSPRPSLQHGQFLPFNTINAGVYSTSCPYNLCTALQEELPNSNPRKYEDLHNVANPNYQFGLELTTSFVQTPNGHDDWGHDIIYEFTGDDDFWLYVDGELVIDLGGVHSALYGSINYATGEVRIQTTGRQGAPRDGDIITTSLYEIFYKNYKGRGHTDAEAQAYVDGIFQLNADGQYVFKDYTPHEMKIFFMERGGGASNLQMRFNQSSVKPKTVILSKELDGVSDVDNFNAEFAYQIYYQLIEDGPFYRLQSDDSNITVVYRNTNRKVKYKDEYYIDGFEYRDVFFLKPGEACEIKVPDEAIKYYVVECGVDPYLYSQIKANEDVLTGVLPKDADAEYSRRDYATTSAAAKDRTSVEYVNTINPDALRVLTFTKYLWDETGSKLTTDTTPFSFRLYLATEYETEDELELANMYIYHVKDPDGRYCRWDSTQQRFVPIRDDATDYNTLTTQEKRLTSFTTSMYGAISKIPAFYTVEIRELLAGTKYKVEEPYEEIPDGYSRIQYVVHDDAGDQGTVNTTKAQGTIYKDKDPDVEVHNIRGYGIRMYKEWTDNQFVADRENTYFAIYRKDGDGEVLVDGTVYQLKFKKNTIYWYFEKLEPGLNLGDYYIREVVLTSPVTDSNGKVTSYGSITPLAEGGELTLSSKLKGDDNYNDAVYKVYYDDSPEHPTPNMRIDTIVNERDGVKIYKKDNHGDPLEGARFEIREKDTGTLIGTFESGDDGFVTFAYLRKDVDYTLAEVKSPSRYTGLKKPVTVRLADDGTLTVTTDPSTASVDDDRISFDNDKKEITVINYRYDFEITKRDKMTNEPVEGVVFALHKQKTVGGVTVVDFQAMAGYDHLETDANGKIQKIDSSLPAGTYELREISTPDTHQGLNYYILFTVTQTGDIRLNAVHPEVQVDETIENDRVVYTLLIYNNPIEGDLMVTKQVEGNLGSRAEKFPMTVALTDADGQAYVGTVHTRMSGGGAVVDHVLTTDDNGVISFELSHGDTIVFTGIEEGTNFTVTEQTKGYQSKGYLDAKLVSETGIVSGNTKDNSSVRFVNTRNGTIPTGLETSFNSSIIMLAVLGAGIIILLAVGRKRRRSEY